MMTEPAAHNASTYRNWGCRCTECTAAWAAVTAKRRARRRALVKKIGLPPSVEHGASAYANWGCRCAICKGAHNADSLRWRKS